MKRQDVEQLMINQGLTQIDIIKNKDDKLAVYCRLVGGKLKDYTNHVIDRKADIWGYLLWENGKSIRKEF